MARNLRSAVLLRIALLSTAAVAVGCATSAEVDDEALGSDAGADSGKKDARAVDGAKGGDDDDDDVVGEKDSGNGDPTTDDDAGTDDAGKDAGDAGKDAGDAGDGGKDAGDAGDDAGDAGDGGGDPGDGGSVKRAQGEIVISEVMYNPSGTETKEEWIELHNTAATARDLSGLVLKDGTSPVHTHTIRAGTVIAPGAYVVFASEEAGAIAAKVPAGVVVYEYNKGLATADRLTLGNSDSGSIVLLSGATEIARAKYGALGLGNAANGVSIQLKTLTYAGAGVAANWCKSSTPWVTGSDKGTPGAPSDCP